MKKLLFSLQLLLFTFIGISQSSQTKLKVIVVFLGERNMDFNEYNYKNLNFYYTPKLQAYNDSILNKLVFKGKPKIIEEWWAHQDIQHHAILYDRQGIGAWEGTLNNESDIFNCRGFDNQTFTDALNKYVIQRETVIETDREFTFYSSKSIYRGKYYQNPFIERKAIPFYIYDRNYNTVLINSLLEEDTPTLFLFCYLETNYYLQPNYLQKEKDSKQTNTENFRTLKIITELDKLHQKYNKS